MEFDGLQVMEGATKDVTVPSRGLMKVDYRVRVLNVDSARALGKALTDVGKRRDGGDAAGRSFG